MTLTLTNTFGPMAAGNVPASDLDTDFQQLGAQVIIQCTTGGTANAIALTLGNIAVTAFADIANTHFGFSATSASTGNVTVAVGSLAAKNLYLTDGLTQAGSGDIISGQYYEIVYLPALNSGGGGFQICNQVPLYTAGTWTPTDQSGASLTFTSVNCNFVRMGRIVQAYGTLTYPTTANGSTAKISLPVNVPNQSYAQTACGILLATHAADSYHAVPQQNTNYFEIVPQTNAPTALTNAQLTGIQLNMMIVYPST